MEQDLEKSNNDIEPQPEVELKDIDYVDYSINKNNAKFLSYIVPLLLICFILSGFTTDSGYKSSAEDNSGFKDFNINHYLFKNNTINILSEKDLSMGIKDTVYTDMECWLELKIDQQMVYQYWRNGKIEKYPVSTGNKNLKKGIESRPGLFAIFYKEEHHQSTQFDNADMYHFMPFDMGVGFHSLNGTGYYGNLGKIPSSHGCIRMKHEDAKKLFKDCPLGTLVLATKGYSSRIVAFAPKDFKNNEEYSKDEYKQMISENLYNILEGNYYIKERKYFVVDPKIIPTSGIYTGYDRKIPEKQKLPSALYVYANNSDKLEEINTKKLEISKIDNNSNDYASTLDFIEEVKYSDNKTGNIDADLIKKYFHNPIGILPYFPPDK